MPAPFIAAIASVLFGAGIPATIVGLGAVPTAVIKADALASANYAALHRSCPLAAPALDLEAKASGDSRLQGIARINDALCAAVRWPNTLINRVNAARALIVAAHAEFDPK